MSHQITKGRCSNCKVCKAYLREVRRNQAKNAADFIEGDKPDASPHTKWVAATGLLVAEKLMHEEGENSGCPSA